MTSELIDWQSVLGPLFDGFGADELQALECAIHVHPRRGIRLAPDRDVSELPFDVESVPWYATGYLLADNDVRPGAFLHYAAGDYYIQDAGSLLALALGDIQPGQMVCDTCASPGGKSTGVLERLDGSGLLLSNEVIGSRLALLKLSLSRTGYCNHLTTNLDLETLSSHLPQEFDCVIVDAPCTGQSMVARGKQSMAAYSQSQIEHSSARQLRIIRAASELVKPGGRLVYSTCTFAFAENEHIVSQLLLEQSEWNLQRYPELSTWESPGFPGCYRLWPHRDPTAGAFAAALIRDSDGTTAREQSASKTTRAPRRYDWQRVDQLPQSVDWLTGAWHANVNPPVQLYRRGHELHGFPVDCPADWLNIAISGVPLAEWKGDRIQPLYGASLLKSSTSANARQLDLDDQQASRFVGGEAIRIEHTLAAGWTVVTWRQRPLGWGKVSGGMLKNHYPKLLRQP
ncbi:MAG: hypothetical protein R3C53_01545 [Pirellulaceae bacterium]